MKPIATREFSNEKTGEPIVASVDAPRHVSREEWACRFVISGLAEPHSHDAFGVDALQALFQPFQGIRYFLTQSGLHAVHRSTGGGRCYTPRA